MIASSCNVCLLSLQRYERPHAALADTIATDITEHQSIVGLTDNDFHLLLQILFQECDSHPEIYTHYTPLLRSCNKYNSLMSSSQVPQTMNRILWVKSLSFPLLCICYFSVCTASSRDPRGHKSCQTEYQWTYFLWINWTGAISWELCRDSWQGHWGTNSSLKPTESWGDFVKCETQIAWVKYLECLLFGMI